MVLKARRFTVREARKIRRTSDEVRARRKALGLLQTELDHRAGAPVGTVDRIERRQVNHRSMPPEHPDLAKVLAALDTLEKSGGRGPGSVHRTSGLRKYPTPRRRKVKGQRPRKLGVERVKYCPDQKLWTTQRGCDGLRKRPDDRSRRIANPCNECPGVDSRRLKSKTVQVEYTPRTPAEIEDDEATDRTYRRAAHG